MKGHQLLLSRKDIDPNRLVANDGTLLGSANMNGHEEVVKLCKPGPLTVAKTGTSAVVPALPVGREFARSRCVEEGGAEGGVRL